MYALYINRAAALKRLKTTGMNKKKMGAEHSWGITLYIYNIGK